MSSSAKITRNNLAGRTAEYNFLPRDLAAPPVAWQTAEGLTPYPQALAFMEQRARNIAENKEAELIWLVEHPPLYTAGTSAKDKDLLTPDRFPVYKSGRGGRFTYHGPGQRVVYIMLDLKRRREDIRAFIAAVEQWGINTLSDFDIKAERREDRVGIWVARNTNPALPMQVKEAKIAAIGLRLHKWVSYHGMAVNISPDLNHYNGIVPCGISEYGVTGMAQLGKNISLSEWDAALKRNFIKIFGKAE